MLIRTIRLSLTALFLAVLVGAAPPIYTPPAGTTVPWTDGVVVLLDQSVPWKVGDDAANLRRYRGGVPWRISATGEPIQAYVGKPGAPWGLNTERETNWHSSFFEVWGRWGSTQEVWDWTIAMRGVDPTIPKPPKPPTPAPPSAPTPPAPPTPPGPPALPDCPPEVTVMADGPQPVVTLLSGWYYRPGTESTGRLNLELRECRPAGKKP